jgi:hypothetical protein
MIYILEKIYLSTLKKNKVLNFFVSTVDYEYPGIRIQVLDTIVNNVVWVDDREVDFERYFFALSKK